MSIRVFVCLIVFCLGSAANAAVVRMETSTNPDNYFVFDDETLDLIDASWTYNSTTYTEDDVVSFDETGLEFSQTTTGSDSRGTYEETNTFTLRFDSGELLGGTAFDYDSSYRSNTRYTTCNDPDNNPCTNFGSGSRGRRGTLVPSSEVPLPPALPLLGAAIGLMWGVRRRRQTA